MMRLDTHNKFIRAGCFLLCCLLLVFLYIVMVRKEILLLVLGGMAVFWAVKKRWLMAAFCICLVLLGWVCTFEWTNTRKTLEKVHFELLKSFYQSKTEKYLEEIVHAEDTNVWRTIDRGFDLFLSKRTYYIKKEGHVVILFTTKFSDDSGYIYLADDEAYDLIAEPWKYWNCVSESPLFTEIHKLDGQWLFIRTYRGDGTGVNEGYHDAP